MAIIEYYLCPICGKTTPLKSFNPSVDLDSLGYIQKRVGGGRGSGFKFLEEHALKEVSSEYPEVLEILKERVNGLKDHLTPSVTERAKEKILNKIKGDLFRRVLDMPISNADLKIQKSESVERCVNCQLFVGCNAIGQYRNCPFFVESGNAHT